MLTCGIVGLPNVGKSTLFNALTLRQAQGKPAAVAPYAFTTVKPNVGVVPVPDDRLAAVARVMGSARMTPAAMEFVDIAGLVKGAHQGAGLGNEFLSHIRAVDAVVHVVRAFDAGVERAGSVSPTEDIETIQQELRAKDEEISARSEKRKAKNEKHAGETELAEKPVVYVFNIGEDLKVTPETETFQPSVTLCAKLEADLAELPERERPEFLRAYGLGRSRISDLLSSLVSRLSLLTFFTVNENEARAWLVPRGTTAVGAAGKVHTAFAEKFIRAEVVPAADLVTAGSWQGAREQGTLRTEGRDYIVQDGDVLLFKV